MTRAVVIRAALERVLALPSDGTNFAATVTFDDVLAAVTPSVELTTITRYHDDSYTVFDATDAAEAQLPNARVTPMRSKTLDAFGGPADRDTPGHEIDQ